MGVIHQYEACSDCIDCIVNGYLNLDKAEALRIVTAINNVQALDNCELSVTGKELGFTRSPCEICKRGLTGNRYEVVGLT